jgi:hypothetical protein
MYAPKPLLTLLPPHSSHAILCPLGRPPWISPPLALGTPTLGLSGRARAGCGAAIHRPELAILPDRSAVSRLRKGLLLLWAMQPFAGRGDDSSWGGAGAEAPWPHAGDPGARGNAQMPGGDRFVFAPGLQGLSVVQVAADSLIIQPSVARRREDEGSEEEGEEEDGEEEEGESEEEDEEEAAMQDEEGGVGGASEAP